MSSDAAWFVVPKPQSRARLRLFCFPFAGGSSLFYHHWPASLPADVEVVAVEPPGRRSRIMEPPFRALGGLLDALMPLLLPRLSSPFAFFGHSTGALVAYEVTRRLRQQGGPMPLHLFVAGHGAPHLPLRRESTLGLTDDAFIGMLRRYGGTPEAVLNQRELMDLMLPMLRADFLLAETWTHLAEPPLSVPMHVFGGLHDAFTPRADLDAWGEHADTPVPVHMFDDGHFFVTSHKDALMPLLTRPLLESLAATRGT